jgi:hypothetical protein
MQKKSDKLIKLPKAMFRITSKAELLKIPSSLAISRKA